MDEKSHSKRQKRSKQKKDKHKKKSKKSRKRRDSTSSNASTDSKNCEWVEKVPEGPKLSSPEPKKSLEREEWMNLSNAFPCTSNEERKKSRNKKEEEKKNTAILVDPGQSERELNPHWKNGGTGMPEESEDSKRQRPDANWLRKSLKRAQEFAEEQGKTLEEVAAERWGSLDVIKKMISEAENPKSRDRDKYHREKKYSDRRRRSRSRSRDRDRHESRRRPSFRKPDEDEPDRRSFSEHKSKALKNWQKPKFRERDPEVSSSKRSRSPEKEKKVTVEEDVSLTEEEMNQLGAKMVKAEIMGKKELAAALKLKLDRAKQFKTNVAESKSQENVVVLSKTDSRGNTVLLNPRCENPGHSQESSKKKKKVETHEGGQRVRYFADDDKYSLQQMFTQEKGRSTKDDDATFTKIMSKKMDMEEVFEEQITRGDSDAKKDARERAEAIKQHKSMTKSLENCHLCVDSGRMQKHTIITMGSKIYLSLPSFCSLVSGHCILAPITHVPCQTQLDEDVWQELKNFKKTLTRMFQDQNKVPVFFEVYMNRQRFPHMQVECIPLPHEEGSMAPMYFKKALLECESEWATNKKVVDLGRKDLQKSIPKGLPYFAVEFGTDSGFAHVIEDEKLFPKNFAQEIIGGMLDVDHGLWRKPRKESFEQQTEKVTQFMGMWNKYDDNVNQK